MDNADFLRLSQRFEGLHHDGNRPPGRQGRLILNELPQRPPLEELHGDDKKPLPGLAKVKDFDRVGIGEFGGHGHFFLEPDNTFRVFGRDVFENLERNGLIRLGVQRLEHLPGAALADELEHFVSVVDLLTENFVSISHVNPALQFCQCE